MEIKDRIIVALDVDSLEKAKPLVASGNLNEHCLSGLLSRLQTSRRRK